MRYLAKDEVLQSSVEIKIESEIPIPNKTALEQDLRAISKPQLNRKWFGLIRANLWFYNVGDPDKKGIPGWLSNKIGEPPALFDAAKAATSCERMERYLFNHGYYHAKVDYSAKWSQQRAKVTYLVTIKDLFTIDKFTYPTDTSELTQIIKKYKVASPIKVGDAFNVDKMQAERQRIASLLKNKGYFDFNAEYVKFEIDSSNIDSSVSLHTVIDIPEEDSMHHQYRIGDIFIHSEYYLEGGTANLDTLRLGNYHYIRKDQLFRANSILDQILFEKGELYSMNDYRNTFNNLLELGVFKFVNIRFDKKVDEDGKRLLDTYILLTPAKRRQYSVEMEVNNRFTENIFGDSSLGTALTTSYQNRNLWGGAERISYNLFGGVEFNINNSEQDEPINTINLSGQVNVTTPKFLNPVPKKWLTEKQLEILASSKIKTRFSLSDNFVRLLGSHSINASELSFGYDWKYGENTRHFITPISFAYSFVYDTTAYFNSQLEGDLRLRRSFEDRLIIGGSYSYLYSNQFTSKSNRHFSFRGDIELAGNIVRGIEGLLNADFEELLVGELDYSQFVRVQTDYRYYINWGKTTLASRLYGGMGVPYGNSGEILPFIRQFYSGGSNGVRAFRIRGLGPGAYEPDANADVQNIQFQRTGELKLEANVEYRFPLFWYFKGAFFVDAGNVWTLYETSKEGGQFQFDTFFSQIGFGGGAGLRLDVSYFIFRVDLAKPFYKPFLPAGERWTMNQLYWKNKEWRQENFVWQLGIGYPF